MSTENAELTYDEFLQQARQLGVDEPLLDELYPMVRDLLALAHHVSQLVPELHADIDPSTAHNYEIGWRTTFEKLARALSMT